MSSFAFLLVCVQACLIQNVYSQSLAGPLGIGYGAGIAGPFVGPSLASPSLGLGFGAAGLGWGAGIAGPVVGCGCGVVYGGAGAGNVAVAGELPVCGATAVAGQVPIIGAIEYGGVVPAAGSVIISGNCAYGYGCGYY